MALMIGVLLGLGGNTGDPEAAFRRALDTLGREGLIAAASRLWRTRPVGPDQPDFINAAVLITWPTGPRSLLERCREIEADAGRNRTTEERWGPRVLDLDLLLADDLVCRGPSLELPHPRFHERRFALEPAAEVAPDWLHPMMGCKVVELALAARSQDPDAILEVVDWRS